jgi:transaldolase
MRPFSTLIEGSWHPVMAEPAAGPAGGGVLEQLAAEGVSLWLDGACRELLDSGRLDRLVRDRRISGATTNPGLLTGSVTTHPSYLEQLGRLESQGASCDQAVRALLAYDARWACDVLRPVFRASGGLEGQVSVDLDPRLAHDAGATVAEARAVNRAVNRPNVLV